SVPCRVKWDWMEQVPKAAQTLGFDASYACCRTLRDCRPRGASPHGICLGFEMVGARTVLGLGLAFAGLAALTSSLTDIDARPFEQPWRSDRLHPVAALAWAQARCDSKMILAPGTPRLQ